MGVASSRGSIATWLLALLRGWAVALTWLLLELLLRLLVGLGVGLGVRWGLSLRAAHALSIHKNHSSKCQHSQHSTVPDI
jgi:uncharacterized membrane protein